MVRFSPVLAVISAFILTCSGASVDPPTKPPGGYAEKGVLPVGRGSLKRRPCPPGHIVRNVDQISIGMNASSSQVRTAFKDLTASLHLPFVYAIASLKQDVAENERNVALSFMLGGITVVMRKPPRQGVGLAPCQGSKESVSRLQAKEVNVKARRDLQWALALWFTSHTPAAYICRDPSCRPLGANELLPEKRLFASGETYTRRQFLEAVDGSSEADWKKGIVVPYNNSEEITKSQIAPEKTERASNMGSLGPLTPKEVIIDFDPSKADLEDFKKLAAPGTVYPNAGIIEEPLNCENGCTWTFSRGPNLVMNARKFPEGSSRQANLRAMVWETPYIDKVKVALTKAGLNGGKPSAKGYNKCLKLSLYKYGIHHAHTGLWFCPRAIAENTINAELLSKV